LGPFFIVLPGQLDTLIATVFRRPTRQNRPGSAPWGTCLVVREAIVKTNPGFPRCFLALAMLLALSSPRIVSRLAADPFDNNPAPAGPTYQFIITDINTGKTVSLTNIPRANAPDAKKKQFDFVFDTKQNADFAAFIRSAMPSNRPTDEVYSATFSQFDAAGNLTVKWEFKELQPYDLIPQTDPATGDLWFDVIFAYAGLK
jgi:hypothetical protein